MPSRDWTPEQQAAIDDRGGTLLVSAAAGSGKTAVLVERVVGIITDDNNPTDVSELLIVTFSNAAAAEMRQRIGQRLSRMISENPGNYYLQKQQGMLSSAPICTVHAFCMNVIRQNFQYLPISPDFTIMDERELEFMRTEAVMECIERFYVEDEDGSFADLVELLTSGRDDRRLIDTVLKIYDFARSHPFYEDWLDSQLEKYDPNQQPAQSMWGGTLLSYTKESLEYCLNSMLETKELLIGDEKLEKGYLPAWESDIAQIEIALGLINAGEWDKTVESLRNFYFMNLGRVSGDDYEKVYSQQTRNMVKDIIRDLPVKYLNATEQEFKEDIKDLSPKVELLFGLVKEFGRELDERKRQAKKLDFSDLEHLALQLLVRKTDGHYERTEQAIEIASQYKHILVDEYQDTNEVQDLIFTSLAHDHEKLFMVGDIKQSIYRFRLAMPEIFMKRKDRAYRHNNIDYPARIILDKNFRSRREVADSVNFIFKQIMSRDMGEIDYNDEESLKCGAEYPAYEKANPELLMINAEDYDGDEDKTELEARAVAAKIAGMMENGYMVREQDDVMRPARPGDFCILMRSPSGRAKVYAKALQELGIAAQADSSDSFLQSREVSVVISFLKALDNPLLDVELTAVMLSPIFSFSADELAEMRIEYPRTAFYTAVKSSAEKGSEKCKNLLDVFSALRYYATTHQADELIQEIYRVTHWIELVSAMPFGNARQANLLLLVEHATYYHSVGYKGLGGFTALISRIQETGGDLDSSGIMGESSNMVQIMSVHRSKGLEFPIVILADTGRRFNFMDLRDSTLLHSRYGFACVRRDPVTLTQFPTIPMGAIRLELKKEMISEEMRILYVALTRAEEKLIISGIVNTNFQRRISGQHLEPANGKLPSFMVGEATSYMDWILMTMLHHPTCENLREQGEVEEAAIIPDNNNWHVYIVIASEEDAQELAVQTLEWTEQPDSELLNKIETKINYKYPDIAQTLVPNKMAVSEVAAKEAGHDFHFVRRPKFMTQQKLTPAERGNALHKFMQFANYENAKFDLPGEIKRMKTQEYLSPTEVESLSEKSLKDFFDSALADRIFKSPKVYRELRFITEFGKDELESVIPNIDDKSKVVLQGVADCVFVENGKAVVVDYKTDRVTSLNELVERYRHQVMIYRKILRETLNMEVSECVLYSFYLSNWTADVL